MKPVFQTKFGADGNCWPACLASILEIPLEEVDHCACSNEGWIERSQDFLAKFGLYYLEVYNGGPTTPIPENTLVIMGCHKERKLAHVVIARARHVNHYPDGQCKQMEFDVVHDPFPGGSGSLSADSVLLLCRLFT